MEFTRERSWEHRKEIFGMATVTLLLPLQLRKEQKADRKMKGPYGLNPEMSRGNRSHHLMS